MAIFYLYMPSTYALMDSLVCENVFVNDTHELGLKQCDFSGPHIDSVKFSGGIIAGLSMLSPRVLRLVEQTHENIVRGTSSTAGRTFELILPRRSLYILSGPFRYNYTHEILGGKHESKLLCSNPLTMERRISLMYRDTNEKP